MIDYVKILFNGIDIERLSNLPILDFTIKVSEKTGVISTKKIAKYHFCKITIYESGTVLFTGSIHKLFNSLKDIKAPNYRPLTKEEIDKGIKDPYKGFNGNQFTINNILEVREHLQNLFNCEPQQMIFQNIELGVNTTPSFNPNEYLKGLLYHKNKLFEYRYNNNLAQAIHNRFIFKIYNKSNQYGMSEFTLRIELKITRTEEIKGIGLKTFEDVNVITLNKAKEMLLKRFDEVVHFDCTIDKKALSKRENQLLKSYSNSRYWIFDLKPIHRDRHKKRLQQIILKNSKNLHQQLRQEISKKCVMINRLSESAKCVIINSSSIALNITQKHPTKPVKKRVVTGLDLKPRKRVTEINLK